MRTWQNLSELIERSNIDQVCEQMEMLSERERLALALDAYDAVNYYLGIFVKNAGPEDLARLEASKVVLLYCADFAALKDIGNRAFPEAAYSTRVLLFRKPQWLGRWCQLVLKLAPGHQYRTVSALEKAKLVAVPHDENYFQALGLAQFSGEELAYLIAGNVITKRELYFAIADPVLVAGIATPDAVSQRLSRAALLKGFRSMINGRKFDFINLAVSAPARMPPVPDNSGRQWPEVLGNLASQNVLEREELVRISFRMLSILSENTEKKASGPGPVESLAPFFCRLNNILCERKDNYIASYVALAGAVNIVISYYALQILMECDVVNLPVSEICDVLPLTFRYGDKKIGHAALYLIKQMLRRETVSAERNSLGKALVSAFANKNKSIHEDVLAILAEHKLLLSAEVRDKLRFDLDLLQGLNRKMATDLLALNEGAPISCEAGSEVIRNIDNCAAGAFETAEKIGSSYDIEHLPTKLVCLVGLDKLNSEYSEGLADKNPAAFMDSVLQPVDFYSFEVPRLFDDCKIVGISSLDDLIYLVAEARKGKLDPEGYELLLDGIARLWKERPDNFRDTVANLVTLVREPELELPEKVRPLLVVLGKLIDVPVSPAVLTWFHPDLFEIRCFGLLSRMVRSLTLPMLAMPTHKGGWIDPGVLVERVEEYQKNGCLLESSGQFVQWGGSTSFVSQFGSGDRDSILMADMLEFVQALLRLAPDGREQARSKAAGISGDFGRALRFALGQGELGSIERPELALAAYRARFPFEKNNLLAERLPHGLPDGAIPARFHFDFEALEAGVNDRYRTINNLLPDFLPVRSPGDSPLHKLNLAYIGHLSCDWTVADAARLNFLPFLSSYVHNNLMRCNIDWMTWLQNREPILARYAKLLSIEVESISLSLVEHFKFLLEQELPLHQNGVWLVALMLTAKSDDLRRLGLDVLITAIDEGRIEPIALGRAMALLRGFTIVRWVRGLRELARVSALQALFVWSLLNSYVIQLGPCVEIGFLELILELQGEFGFGLRENTLNVLLSITGSGKASKLAKTLAGGGTSWPKAGCLGEAFNHCVGQRRKLVERWARASTYFT